MPGPEIPLVLEPEFQWRAPPGRFAATLAGYTSLHARSRSAIYWGFRGLRLPPGTTVYMPAYHCGVEVQAIVDAGLEVEFYRIRRDLTIDLDSLESRLKKDPGPVFVIHYWGFCQPEIGAVESLCRRWQVPWMEDCALSLLTDRAGSYAPMASFNFYKTFPLCEGGALRADRDRLSELGLSFTPPPAGRVSWRPYRTYVRQMVRRSVGAPALSAYRRLRGARRDSGYGVDVEENVDYSPTGMAWISRRVAASMDPSAIVQRRRDNWQALDSQLSGATGYRKFFDKLLTGVCPLDLVLRVRQRDAFRAALSAQGIPGYAYGDAPHPRMNLASYPDAALLRDELFCLPVHQQLTLEQIGRIADGARRLLAKFGA